MVHSFPWCLIFFEVEFLGICCDTKKVLPRWLSGKESACSAGATGNVRSVAGSGRSLGGGNGNPLLYTCQDNPMDGGSWQAIVREVTEVGYDWVSNTCNTCDTHKFLYKNQCWTEKEAGLFNLHKFENVRDPASALCSYWVWLFKNEIYLFFF